MCVCMRESARFRCMHMGMCVCVCGHICRAPLWTHEARDSEWAMPARLGREAGTAVGLTGDVMGMSWGSGHTDHRDSRLWAPQKHGRDWLDPRAAEGAVTPGTPPVSWPSAGTAFVGSPFTGTKSCGSLGAWMSQVNRQGTAKGDGRTGVSVYLFPYNPLPTSQQGQLMHYSGDLGLPTWPAHAGPHPALWDGHHHCRDLRWAPAWVWLQHESFRLMPFPHLKSMWQVH